MAKSRSLMFERRSFLKVAALVPAVLSGQSVAEATSQRVAHPPRTKYQPGTILNEYTAFLPGEKAAVCNSPKVVSFANLLQEFRSGSADREVFARLGSESRTLKIGRASCRERV